MATTLDHKRGATFGWAGSVTLPTSDWTASVSLVDLRQPQAQGAYGIVATLTLIGQNAADPRQSDYALVLNAPASTTLGWPIRGPQDVLILTGTVWFKDPAGQVVGTTDFAIEVRW